MADVIERVEVCLVQGVLKAWSINDLNLSLWWSYMLGEQDIMLCIKDHRFLLKHYPLESNILLECPYHLCWDGKNDSLMFSILEGANSVLKQLLGGRIKRTPGTPLNVDVQEEALMSLLMDTDTSDVYYTMYLILFTCISFAQTEHSLKNNITYSSKFVIDKDYSLKAEPELILILLLSHWKSHE
ncbi:hypothetical protein CPB84DRAFT_1751643 [Gymnopilus junonius]|uniref:Uncharacterized protein n=1 Tax=Gymnopilus junonius TaxID=109634 RepID=A0A9P5NB20_GYMJU|nr:hypothetical protein CPB84DRAFT_1751643 [Gymnopilus junonius]